MNLVCSTDVRKSGKEQKVQSPTSDCSPNAFLLSASGSFDGFPNQVRSSLNSFSSLPNEHTFRLATTGRDLPAFVQLPTGLLLELRQGRSGQELMPETGARVSPTATRAVLLSALCRVPLTIHGTVGAELARAESYVWRL